MNMHKVAVEGGKCTLSNIYLSSEFLLTIWHSIYLVKENLGHVTNTFFFLFFLFGYGKDRYYGKRSEGMRKGQCFEMETSEHKRFQ